MVRWRYCLLLMTLLLLPLRIDTKIDDDEDDESNGQHTEGEEEEDEKEVDDDDEDSPGKDTVVNQAPAASRRWQVVFPSSDKTTSLSRTTKRYPLECYVCAYKSKAPLRGCLDPSKYRVHTITCENVDDKCFTSVMAKGSSYDAVVRGCRSGCVPAQDTVCCEQNRCNNQAFAIPEIQHKVRQGGTDKANKTMAPSVVFFVSILLVVQTVAKVAFF